MKEQIFVPFKYVKLEYSNDYLFRDNVKITETQKFLGFIPYWKTINVKYH